MRRVLCISGKRFFGKDTLAKLMVDAAAYKQAAARAAVEEVRSGMVVGLGHGSTVQFALEALAEKLRSGALADIIGVPCSLHTEREALRLGIPLGELNDHAAIVHRIAGYVVASTANRQQKASLAGKVDGLHDVGRARAPHDQGRAAIDQAILNSPRVVVLPVVSIKDATPDAASKVLNRRRVEYASVIPGRHWRCTSSVGTPDSKRGPSNGVKQNACPWNPRRCVAPGVATYQTDSASSPSASRRAKSIDDVRG